MYMMSAALLLKIACAPLPALLLFAFVCVYSAGSLVAVLTAGLLYAA